MPTNFEFDVYKDEHRKAFIVFKDLSIPKEEMMKIANNHHFKRKLEDLKCIPGYVDNDEDLYISSRYVEGKQSVWVVTRKE